MSQPVPPSDDRLLLNALVDDELDAATTILLERRLEIEPDLAVEYRRLMALKERVSGLDRPPVTRGFEARIGALMTQRAKSLTPANRSGFYRNLSALAASIIVTAVLASGGTYLFTTSHSGFSIEDEVAGGHRRSLLATSPVDVASSDRHTVKPWLDAKLGVSPPATDLAADGYPLIGGRVDVLGAETVPTLVYRHNEHLITLMAEPGAHGTVPPSFEVASGYNIVHWTEGGFAFWAVSDLEQTELEAFVRDYRSS